MAVSRNGWTAGTKARLGIRDYTVPGTTVPILGGLLPSAAPLLLAAAADWHRQVEPLHDGWCWGWAGRPERGGALPSAHSSGTAVDLNAPKHPLGVRGTLTRGQAATARAIASRYGLTWGGVWDRPDEMHLELADTAAEAARRITRLGLRADGTRREWDEMATKDEIKAAIREVLAEPAIENDDGAGLISRDRALYRCYSQARTGRILLGRLATKIGVRLRLIPGVGSENPQQLQP